MVLEGLTYRRLKRISSLPKFKHGIYSRTAIENNEDVENANFVDSNSNVSFDDVENVPTTKPRHSKVDFFLTYVILILNSLFFILIF